MVYGGSDLVQWVGVGLAGSQRRGRVRVGEREQSCGAGEKFFFWGQKGIGLFLFSLFIYLF
jgi:hypothetical protein